MRIYRKVVIAGETWSSNLGDGVIAETLQFLFKTLLPDLNIDFLDISGRSPISQSPPKSTSSIIRFMQKLKLLDVFRIVSKWYILRSQHIARWSSQISESDAVIIGGGQLLMDNALDFPLKVNTIAQLSYSLGVNTHFLSCGVGRKWSGFALDLFRKALMPAASVTVRDTLSKERLGSFLPGLMVGLSADPALWASAIYGQERLGDNRVGLGIMYVNRTNTQRSVRLSTRELIEFWAVIIRRLHQDGIDFELFTNGSQQDYRLALDIITSVQQRSNIPCNLAPRPRKPSELARRISQYRAVIASRLHAHIIATSYCIPSIGLIWDDKVTAFFKDTGRENLVFNGFDVNEAGSIVDTLYQIIDTHVDEAIVKEKKALIVNNVQAILAAAGLL